MEKKSYTIQRNLLRRIKNEMDSCYNLVSNVLEHCVDYDDKEGAMFNSGKQRAYSNVCDYIEGLLNELNELYEWNNN